MLVEPRMVFQCQVHLQQYCNMWVLAGTVCTCQVAPHTAWQCHWYHQQLQDFYTPGSNLGAQDHEGTNLSCQMGHSPSLLHSYMPVQLRNYLSGQLHARYTHNKAGSWLLTGSATGLTSAYHGLTSAYQHTHNITGHQPAKPCMQFLSSVYYCGCYGMF